MNIVKNYISGYVARGVRSTLLATSFAITFVVLAMSAHADPKFPIGVTLTIPGSNVTYVATTNDTQYGSGTASVQNGRGCDIRSSDVPDTPTYGPFSYPFGNVPGKSVLTLTFSAPVHSYSFRSLVGRYNANYVLRKLVTDSSSISMTNPGITAMRPVGPVNAPNSEWTFGDNQIAGGTWTVNDTTGAGFTTLSFKFLGDPPPPNPPARTSILWSLCGPWPCSHEGSAILYRHPANR